MPSLTIRALEPETKDELRRRAAAHGRSIQDEARTTLRDVLVVSTPPASGNLYARIRARFEPLGGVELELPPRVASREPSASTEVRRRYGLLSEVMGPEPDPAICIGSPVRLDPWNPN